MTDFAWLIEAPGQHYLATRELAGFEFFWTKNHAEATRFMSEAQADGVMMAVRQLNPDLFGFAVTLGEARPVEHGWVGPPSEAEVTKYVCPRCGEEGHLHADGCPNRVQRMIL